MDAHEQIEDIVDRLGVSRTLEIIADVCYGKADHIQENWQDEKLARHWRSASARLMQIQDSVVFKRL